MRTYPEQPYDKVNFRIPIDTDRFAKHIRGFLKEELPDSGINEWWLETAYFANCIDKLAGELIDGFHLND